MNVLLVSDLLLPRLEFGVRISSCFALKHFKFWCSLENRCSSGACPSIWKIVMSNSANVLPFWLTATVRALFLSLKATSEGINDQRAISNAETLCPDEDINQTGPSSQQQQRLFASNRANSIRFWWIVTDLDWCTAQNWPWPPSRRRCLLCTLPSLLVKPKAGSVKVTLTLVAEVSWRLQAGW